MFAYRRHYAASMRSQRGVAAIMAAVLMFSMVAFMALVTDTGRLYFEKRSQQKNTDLAALETALRYCRNQSLDDSSLDIAAENVMARNNYDGDFQDGGDSTIDATLIDANTVQVIVTRNTVPSLFQRMMNLEADTIILSTSAIAKACEPSAKLAIATTLADVDLLNNVLGDFVGGPLALTLAGYNGLLDASINLLDFTEALVSVGISVGEDGLISGSAAITDILSVAVSVLNSAGGDSAIAASILQTQVIDQIITAPNIALGDLLSISSEDPESALDIGLGVFDLVQGAIYLAGEESDVVADVPIALLGLADVTVQLQVTEPPRIAVGNPERARLAPYGSQAIYVRSAQVRSYVSLELPILGTLDGLLTSPLISEITDTVNDLLSLNLVGVLADILCILACEQEEDMTDIDILSSPRIDIGIFAGTGEARVTDYDCDDEENKALYVDTSTSAANVALGRFGSTEADASAAVFSSDPLIVEPVPIVDIGTIRVKKTCVLAICSYSYQQGSGWVSDKSLADRDAFSGGGIGLSLDTSIVGDTSSMVLSAPASAACDSDFVDAYELEFCDEFNAQDPLEGLASTLSGAELTFYNPTNGSLLGIVTSLLTSVVDTLVSELSTLLSTTLSTVLDPVVNMLLDTLGVSLANADVGGALVCQNDRVRLVQ